MAKDKSQDRFDDRNQGLVGLREANIDCLTNKDDYLGFVGSGGVLIKDSTIEKGKLMWHVIRG